MSQAPFDRGRLDALLATAGIDIILATSRANVLYLTGGHYHHPFARSADHGDTHYVSFAGVPRSDGGEPFMVAAKTELAELEARDSWIAESRPAAVGTLSAALAATDALLERGLARAVVGVEPSHLPVQAAETLRARLPNVELVDALPLLLELRAVKRPDEQLCLHAAAEITARAIDAAISEAPATLQAAHDRVAAETEGRGGAFVFAYCSAGPGRLRFPRARAWQEGELLQVDSGCDVGGYLSDVCRMAARGTPPPVAYDLYEACLDAQQRIAQGIRPGVLGRELTDHAARSIAAQHRSEPARAVIHGIGLGHHELPDLTADPYRPLEEGNVLSIEVEFEHPHLGMVKIEDALAITPSGSTVLGLPFGGLRTVV